MPDRSILLKCLSGHATPEEAEMVDTWMAASPENREEFDRLWEVWQRTADNPGYVRPDIGVEWNILQAKLDLPGGGDASSPGKDTSSPGKDTSSPGKDTSSPGRDVSSSARQGSLPGGDTLSSGRDARDMVKAVSWKSISVVGAGIIVVAVLLFRVLAPAVTIDGGEVKNTQVVRASGASIVKDTLSGHTEIRWDTQRSFNFNNTPVKEVIVDLAKAYGVAFRLDNPAIGDCRITTAFENKPIGYVLDVLTETLNLKYRIKAKEKMVVISGQGCE